MPKMRLSLPSSLLLLAIASLPVAADTSLTEGLNKVFESVIDADGPGCNVGVLSNGEWAHKQGYGLANLELGVPLDGTQLHRMGSVSKQFTAAAVLLLADEGKIDLSADIHRYLPDLPDYAAPVTINAMLGHVAGMGDYDLISGSYEGPIADNAIDLKSVAGGPFRMGNEDYLTIEEFYDVVAQVPLAQPPEQAFLYSNLAYFLLSMLVEEVSGESLREYAQRRMFEPLGMRSTFFSDDPFEIVKNRAYGYKTLESGARVNDMTNLFWVGDGGLHTSLDDMRRWDRQFYEPVLGRNPSVFLEHMNTANSSLSARGDRYANGQFVSTYQGQQIFSHSGGWLGTLTYYGRIPELSTSLMMMCNDATIDLGALIEAALPLLVRSGDK
ncbi:MAG: serine hydrolase domain-containing protein [Congregibacter sp.]